MTFYLLRCIRSPFVAPSFTVVTVIVALACTKVASKCVFCTHGNYAWCELPPKTVMADRVVHLWVKWWHIRWIHVIFVDAARKRTFVCRTLSYSFPALVHLHLFAIFLFHGGKLSIRSKMLLQLLWWAEGNSIISFDLTYNNWMKFIMMNSI